MKTKGTTFYNNYRFINSPRNITILVCFSVWRSIIMKFALSFLLRSRWVLNIEGGRRAPMLLV